MAYMGLQINQPVCPYKPLNFAYLQYSRYKKKSFYTSHPHVSDELDMGSYFFIRLRAAKGMLKELAISIVLITVFFFIVSHVSTRSVETLLPKSLASWYGRWSGAVIGLVAVVVLVRLGLNLKNEWIKWRGPAPCDKSCPVDFTPVAVGEFAGKSLFDIVSDYGLAPLVIGHLEAANIGRRQHRGHRRILSLHSPLQAGQVVAWPFGVGIPGYGKLAGFIPLSSSAVAGAKELDAAISEYTHDDPSSLLDATIAIKEKRETHELSLVSPDDEDMKRVAVYLAQKGQNEGIFMFSNPSDLECPWLVAELAWLIPSEFLNPAWMSVQLKRWSPSIDDFLDLVWCCIARFPEITITYPSAISEAIDLLAAPTVDMEQFETIGDEVTFSQVVPLGMHSGRCVVASPPVDLEPIKIQVVVGEPSEYAEAGNHLYGIYLAAMAVAHGISAQRLVLRRESDETTWTFGVAGSYSVEIGDSGYVAESTGEIILSRKVDRFPINS